MSGHGGEHRRLRVLGALLLALLTTGILVNRRTEPQRMESADVARSGASPPPASPPSYPPFVTTEATVHHCGRPLDRMEFRRLSNDAPADFTGTIDEPVEAPCVAVDQWTCRATLPTGRYLVTDSVVDATMMVGEWSAPARASLPCDASCSLKIRVTSDGCGSTGSYRVFPSAMDPDAPGLPGEWSSGRMVQVVNLPCGTVGLIVGGGECATERRYATARPTASPEVDRVVLDRGNEYVLRVEDARTHRPISGVTLTAPVASNRIQSDQRGVIRLRLPRTHLGALDFRAPGYAPAILFDPEPVLGPVDRITEDQATIVPMWPTAPAVVVCYDGAALCDPTTLVQVGNIGVDTGFRSCRPLQDGTWLCDTAMGDLAHAQLGYRESPKVQVQVSDRTTVALPDAAGDLCLRAPRAGRLTLRWAEADGQQVAGPTTAQGVDEVRVSIDRPPGTILDATVTTRDEAWSGTVVVGGVGSQCTDVTLAPMAQVCVEAEVACTVWQLRAELYESIGPTHFVTCSAPLPAGPITVECRGEAWDLSLRAGERRDLAAHGP